MLHTDRRNNLVIITSEPLTADPTDWYVKKLYQLQHLLTHLFLPTDVFIPGHPLALPSPSHTTRVPIPTNHTIVVTLDTHVLLSPMELEGPRAEPNMSTSLKALAGEHCVNKSPWPHMPERAPPVTSFFYRPPGRLRQATNVQVAAAEDGTPLAAVNCGSGMLGRWRHASERHVAVEGCTSHAIKPVNEPPAVSQGVNKVPPRHILPGHTDTVLCMAVCNGLVFSGSQDNTIRVWNPVEYRAIHQLSGHTGSILALSGCEADSGAWSTPEQGPILFSCSSDCTLRLWRATAPFSPLVVVSFVGMGDILSVSVAAEHIFLGFMDTRVRAVGRQGLQLLLEDAFATGTVRWTSAASMEADHGLDGEPQPKPASNSTTGVGSAPVDDALWVPPELRLQSSGAAPWTRLSCVHRLPVPPAATSQRGGRSCALRGETGTSFVSHASAELHFGYVYTMTICRGRLATGAGDGLIKIWSLDTMQCVTTFRGHLGSIPALCADSDEGLLFSGSRDQTVRTWDMEALCEKKVSASLGTEVLALEAAAGRLYCGCANGDILALSTESLHRLRWYRTGGPSVQSLRVCASLGLLLVGSGRDVILWPEAAEEGALAISAAEPDAARRQDDGPELLEHVTGDDDQLVEHLRNFVAFPSVSGSLDAKFVNGCFEVG
jgi:WD40 repeat protein